MATLDGDPQSLTHGFVVFLIYIFIMRNKLYLIRLLLCSESKETVAAVSVCHLNVILWSFALSKSDSRSVAPLR